MKKNKANIKKIIKAQLEINQKVRNDKPVLSDPVEKSKPQVRKTVTQRIMEEYRNTPNDSKPQLSKHDRAFAAGVPNYIPTNKKDEPVELKDYGAYIKQENVDFDVVICICSFDRYDKVRRLLKQLYSQESIYTFKVVLMDDCSEDYRYLKLVHEFPELEYHRQSVNGGKSNYWKTVNELWSHGAKYSCHGFLQIDDDFIICNAFLNNLMDEFFKAKEQDNCNMVFSYHIYGYYKDQPQADWWYNGVSIAIDGGTLFDNRFLKLFDHYVDIGKRVIAEHTSTFFWDTIVHKHIRNFGVRVHRMPKSLAWHDGNFDSKLHAVTRKIKKSYTKNFIDGDDKYNPDIEFNQVK